MRVLKFGGTSVGSIENIEKVIAIVKSQPTPVAVVVSALGGITDKLLEAGERAAQKDDYYAQLFFEIRDTHFAFTRVLTQPETPAEAGMVAIMEELEALLQGIYLINELSAKTIDKLLSFGERLSSLLIAEAMLNKGLNATAVDSRNFIKTDEHFTKATVNHQITDQLLSAYFDQNTTDVSVFGGFIASTPAGETTTLGRGGSDFTAAIIAAATGASQLEIWTDVSGMFTANPKLVRQAKPIKTISYDEAMELSHFGAKVLYPPTIVPVMRKNIPIIIKNTMQPEATGTRISTESNGEDTPIKGISHVSEVALLTLEGVGMVGIPGIAKRFFETLSNHAINIVLITQASSEHSICIGVLEHDAKEAQQSVNETFAYEISLGKIEPLHVEQELAIIALVGERMKSHQGISGKMFQTLGQNNVNIRAIAQGASEKNISAVIAKKDVSKALNSLHERFFEDQYQQINLFITGVGNVGTRLLSQIEQQHKFLKEKLHLNIRVLGLSNSRKMLLNPAGIKLSHWKEQLENEGKPASLEGFRESVIRLNKRNAVFLDITANEAVALSYPEYLKNSIAVIACNKIACAHTYEHYALLKNLSRRFQAPFLFETNVGAGLPIIDTLQNLIASGDRILKIEAVLSGSLNFVFNHFKSGYSFHDVVLQAKKEGYTEPDPRIDLSGVDVARKILILARESGLKLELEDIQNNPFLTEKNLNSTDISHFFETLTEDADHFEKLVNSAQDKGNQLKYVATLEGSTARVGLQEVGAESPFYNLEGKDNIVLFYTTRYPNQPLIVKGAGAGGDVTASGLFADIIRLRKV